LRLLVQLPAEFSGIREDLDAFQRSAHALCRRIFRAFALGFEIPETEGGATYFESKHPYEAPSGNTLRILHYPPLSEEAKLRPESELRAGW